MLRSKTTVTKRQPLDEMWSYLLRLPPDLEAPLRERAKQRGVTLRDEIELAIRAALQTPLPVTYEREPRPLTPFERMVIIMRRARGETYASIARDFNAPPSSIRFLCEKDK